MTVPFERDFDPGDNFPSVVMDALQRMLTALGASVPCPIRIKPGASNTLQVAAGAGQDAIAVPVGGAWRWIESAAEQAGSGSAGDRDVWACSAASDYEAGSPGETDATDRSFALRITAVDASAPGGFALTRRVARATWDGSQWTDVAPIISGVVITPGQVGDIKATARATAPIGWLPCDGAAVSRTTYAVLFALIGTTYGAGNGTTTFNVPDMRGRVPVGVDGSAARLGNSPFPVSHPDTLGAAGGGEGVQLSIPNLPAGVPADFGGTVDAVNVSSGSGNSVPKAVGGSGWATGASLTTNDAVSTMQPYQIVNWVIRT